MLHLKKMHILKVKWSNDDYEGTVKNYIEILDNDERLKIFLE